MRGRESARGARALARPAARRVRLRALRPGRDRPPRGAAPRLSRAADRRSTSPPDVTPSSSASSRRSSPSTRCESASRAQLMLALYRSGRQAEALAAYQAARRALVEELGIEPDRALRELEQAILTQDPALDLDGRRSTASRGSLGGAPARRGGRRAMRRGFPTGTVTLLFADVEGSTRLLHALGERYCGRATPGSASSSGPRPPSAGAARSIGQGTACFSSSSVPVTPWRQRPTCSARSTPSSGRESAQVRMAIGIHTGEPELDARGLRRHRRARGRPHLLGRARWPGRRLAGRRATSPGRRGLARSRSAGSATTGSRTCPPRRRSSSSSRRVSSESFPPLSTLGGATLPALHHRLVGRRGDLAERAGPARPRRRSARHDRRPRWSWQEQAGARSCRRGRRRAPRTPRRPRVHLRPRARAGRDRTRRRRPGVTGARPHRTARRRPRRHPDAPRARQPRASATRRHHMSQRCSAGSRISTSWPRAARRCGSRASMSCGLRRCRSRTRRRCSSSWPPRAGCAARRGFARPPCRRSAGDWTAYRSQSSSSRPVSSFCLRRSCSERWTTGSRSRWRGPSISRYASEPCTRRSAGAMGS